MKAPGEERLGNRRLYMCLGEVNPKDSTARYRSSGLLSELATEDDRATESLIEHHSRTFPGPRRLSWEKLHPIRAGPFPGGILVNSAVSAAKEDDLIQILIKGGGRTINCQRLSSRRL